MKRTTKEPDVRKGQFLSTAARLFDRKGFEATSVDDIVDSMGVAKGLFYYYFESKEELLSLMTERLLQETREMVTKIVAKEDASAMEKVELLMAASAGIKARSAAITSFFHQPRNKLLHFGIEQRSHEFLVPALESIVEQGMREGVFHTKHPHETVVAYLGAASAVGHEGIENLTDELLLRRVEAFQYITEKMLGCRPGSFKVYERLAKEYIARKGRTKQKRPKRSGR